jgi:inorganic pyrophosphatase
VPLSSLDAFTRDGLVNIVVESPRGSTVKLKYDGERELFTISRPLVEGLAYPYDWGFVPSTCAADGDPLDAMILWDRASYPGVVIPCRLIGVLRVEQNKKGTEPPTRERNDRVLALPADAPQFEHVHDIGDLPNRKRDELESFFLAATAFENKALKLLGWADAGEALALVKASMRR